MFSRFAHKITKGNLKPATVDAPSNVLVVGATSQVGLAIIEELQQGSFARMFKVHAAVIPDEAPEKLQKLKDLGIEYFPFDIHHMSQAEDYINKFEINALVLTNAALMENTKAGRAWIDTARRANVDFFLMLSSINADKAQYALAKQFKGLEKYISSNAPYHCIVRTTPFLDLLLLHSDEIRENKTLTMPLSKDASFAPIDTKDVARAIVFILLDAGHHHGQIHELTGPSCKTGEGLARALTKNLGEEIQYKEFSMEDARAFLKSKGWTEEKIEGFLSSMENVNQHGCMYVYPNFAQITGERQRRISDFVQRNKDVFLGRREE